MEKEPLALMEPNGTNLNHSGSQRPTQLRTNLKSKRSISHRWYYVISLHLSGYSAQEISGLTGFSTQRIYSILRDERSIQVRQSILSGLDDELQALYPQVVQAMRDALQSPDIKVRLQASDQWFRTQGKFKGDQKGLNVTAEDVVIQILNQAGSGG